MNLSFWQWPGRLVDTGRAVIGTAGQLMALTPRVVALVGEVELLLGRVSAVVGQVEAVVDSVQSTQQRAMAQIDRVAAVATVAGHTADRASDLVTEYLPALEKLRPIVERIASTTDPQEVESVVELIDLLPTVVHRLDADILPVLHTLGTVAPDLHDLLRLSREINEMLSSIPGLGWIRDRADRRIESEDKTELVVDQDAGARR